jgi:hypothetical protein
MRRRWHGLALVVAIVALAGCAAVTYQKPGHPITPRAGETLVFGRVRFFHNGKEFFPWEVKVVFVPVPNTERYVWLLRLGQRAVSAELHPEGDGSLAIWLARGDYALVGSNEAQGAGVGAFYVVALFRVPADIAAMSAGDLIFRTESHEGGHWSSAFGDAFVAVQPAALARDSLAKKFGALPEPFTVSAWCAGDSLPGFDDPDLAKRGKDLLDRGCPGRR